MKTKLLIVIALVLSGTQLRAQYVRCGADEHQANLEANDPQIRASRIAAEEAVNRILQNNPEYRTTGSFNIPVVFHIIYNTANAAAENIPDARIYEQLNVIGDDYNRTNADSTNTRSIFVPVAGSVPISFCLSQQTPTGASSNGIIRVPTSLSQLPNNPSSLSPEWDHTKYLNIYVGNLGGGLLGYTNFPPGSPGNDHVVILYSAIGGPNVPGTAVPYHLGRTATHEIGHWLNLYHTFEGGCAGLNANNCASQGDHICDTPPLSGPTFGCPSGSPNTCTETSPWAPPFTGNMVDMYENYMDYTDDPCMNAYTQDQTDRMSAAITALRPLLLTSPGCIPVGLSETMDATYLTLSPNPSHGIFQVQFNYPTAIAVQLEVSDLAGRLVYTSKYNTGFTSSTSLDLSNFSEGVYQLTAHSESGYLVKRIVIAR